MKIPFGSAQGGFAPLPAFFTPSHPSDEDLSQGTPTRRAGSQDDTALEE